LSSARIVEQLRLAARKGDRSALLHAVAQMKVMALSPRYWQKYLVLLANPLARLVDLLVIKQGERIAQQKGRKIPARVPRPRPTKPTSSPTRPPRRARPVSADQQTLFD
jgi:hypothetical protein